MRDYRQMHAQRRIHRQEEKERIHTDSNKTLSQRKDLQQRINREGRHGWQEGYEHNRVPTQEQEDRQTELGVNSRNRQALTNIEDQYRETIIKVIHINQDRRLHSVATDRQIVEQNEHQTRVSWDKETETHADRYRTHKTDIQYDESIGSRTHDMTEHQNIKQKSLNKNRQTIRQYDRHNELNRASHTISSTHTEMRSELSREKDEMMSGHSERQEARVRDTESRQRIEAQRVRRSHQEEEGTRKGQIGIQYDRWEEEESRVEKENEVREDAHTGGVRFGVTCTDKGLPDESKLQRHDGKWGKPGWRIPARTEGQLDSNSENTRMEVQTDRMCDTHTGRLTMNKDNEQDERQVSLNSGQETRTRVAPQRKYVTWWDVH
jgi:hypothetical protein